MQALSTHIPSGLYYTSTLTLNPIKEGDLSPYHIEFEIASALVVEEGKVVSSPLLPILEGKSIYKNGEDVPPGADNYLAYHTMGSLYVYKIIHSDSLMAEMELHSLSGIMSSSKLLLVCGDPELTFEYEICPLLEHPEVDFKFYLHDNLSLCWLGEKKCYSIKDGNSKLPEYTFTPEASTLITEWLFSLIQKIFEKKPVLP